MPQRVGVVVARFQVHKLHEGHTGLISHALSLSDRVIVYLGNSPLKNSTANPLDFRSREQMVRSAFWPFRERLTIKYIDDTGDNASWAAALDAQIMNDVPQKGLVNVTLYGGRDSFIPHYKDGGGSFPTAEYEHQPVPSGTEIRKEIAQSDARDSEDWRAALIAASQDRFPTSYQCVDVAVLRSEKTVTLGDDPRMGYKPTHILLARKKHDKLLRFFGGFVDPTDSSLEAAAYREVAEECNGIAVDGARYLGSARVDDWRYANEPDGIMTALITVQFQWGHPKPTDDLAGGEVKWVALDELKVTDIVPQHRHLYDMLINKGL